MAKCPNCKSEIPWDVTICPGCTALFSLESVWRPVPDNDEEAEKLANKYATQPGQADEPLTVGAGIWTVFKLCLSIVLILVVVSGGVMYFRGPGLDWTGFAFLGLFLFLAALPWVDLRRPSKALALTVLVFALGFAAMARSYLIGAVQLPRTCIGRRVLLCALENELYAFGGAEAVAALWFATAAAVLYGAWRIFIRSRQVPQDAVSYRSP